MWVVGPGKYQAAVSSVLAIGLMSIERVLLGLKCKADNLTAHRIVEVGAMKLNVSFELK